MLTTPSSQPSVQVCEYLCRWHGHDPDFATWEPEAFLPQALVQAYLDAQAKRVAHYRSYQDSFA